MNITPLTVYLLNTTPERKPQTMSRALSLVAGLVLLCVILGVLI